MTTVGNIVAGTQVLDKALIGRGAAFAGTEVMNVNGDVVLQGDLSAVGKTITCQNLFVMIIQVEVEGVLGNTQRLS